MQISHLLIKHLLNGYFQAFQVLNEKLTPLNEQLLFLLNYIEILHREQQSAYKRLRSRLDFPTRHLAWLPLTFAQGLFSNNRFPRSPSTRLLCADD